VVNTVVFLIDVVAPVVGKFPLATTVRSFKTASAPARPQRAPEISSLSATM
jgi:hypothetical protein